MAGAGGREGKKGHDDIDEEEEEEEEERKPKLALSFAASLDQSPNSTAG